MLTNTPIVVDVVARLSFSPQFAPPTCWAYCCARHPSNSASVRTAMNLTACGVHPLHANILSCSNLPNVLFICWDCILPCTPTFMVTLQWCGSALLLTLIFVRGSGNLNTNTRVNDQLSLSS
mgnify:CR=1 FL=1